MQKISIMSWPYPDNVKAMLLKIGNPVYDGSGNWHTQVTFRSVYKEDKTISLDWGLLPMLAERLSFCNRSVVKDSRGTVQELVFDNTHFRFFIDRIRAGDVIIERPAFQARIQGTYYNIPAIEVARSFFARTRKLAYALLESNSIMPLCQCEIDNDEPKRVVVHLSPECPRGLTREKWLPSLVWMATDELAQKSWDSFFCYFQSCQGIDVHPEGKVDTPVFPLHGCFSITGRCRGYGNTVWIDEIYSAKTKGANDMPFEQIMVVKYINECNNGSRKRYHVASKSATVEVVNSAQSATKGSVTVEADLPSFQFQKQPKICFIEKLLATGKVVKRIENTEATIGVTGKNEGFINSKTGIAFSATDEVHGNNEDTSMLSLPRLKEVGKCVLQHNSSLVQYLNTMKAVSRRRNVLGSCTKLFEFPTDSSFAWITLQAKRCCAISAIKLTTGKTIYIIEADRTIYGSKNRLHVATLLMTMKKGTCSDLIYELVEILAQAGHWAEGQLKTKDSIIYSRLKHGKEDDTRRWAGRILDSSMNL